MTALGVTTFGPPAEKHALRLELSFTLFLTMIAFKFVINKFIPRISYLTTLVRTQSLTLTHTLSYTHTHIHTYIEVLNSH